MKRRSSQKDDHEQEHKNMERMDKNVDCIASENFYVGRDVSAVHAGENDTRSDSQRRFKSIRKVGSIIRNIEKEKETWKN